MVGNETAENLLVETDLDYLQSKGYHCELSQVDSFVHVAILEFPFPQTYFPSTATLLIRLPAGYPNANPDMFWTTPDVRLRNGSYPAAAEVHETHGGKSWQRWSRHLTKAWRPGVDCIQTFLTAIKVELNKEI